jgi:hypothetical protein
MCIISWPSFTQVMRVSAPSHLSYATLWGGLGVYLFFLEYSPALFNILHFLFLEVGQWDDVMTAVGRHENAFVIGDSTRGVSTRPFYVVNSTIFWRLSFNNDPRKLLAFGSDLATLIRCLYASKWKRYGFFVDSGVVDNWIAAAYSVVDCCEVNRDEYSPTTGLLSFSKL